MAWMIFLLAAGVILVCLEIFIPGGVVGAIGALALLASVWLAFRHTDFGPTWLLVTLSLTLAGILVSVRFVARSPLGKKLFLHTDEKDYRGTDEALAGLLGHTGTALSDLRPSGIADFSGQRVDVVTGGDFLSRGSELRVLEVSGNRVVVEKLTANENQGGKNAG